MHQEMWRDAQRADLERLAWVPLNELHLGRHVAQPHRKVGRVSLVRERSLQRFRRTRWSDDRQMSPRHERRQKEWKSLDVVKVRVGDQEMGLQRLGRTERASELGNARTRIDYEQVAFLVPHLDTRGVAAVAQGAASRGGTCSPRTPELDPHRAAAGT